MWFERVSWWLEPILSRQDTRGDRKYVSVRLDSAKRMLEKQ